MVSATSGFVKRPERGLTHSEWETTRGQQLTTSMGRRRLFGGQVQVMKDLLRIIRKPGYTTPAEMAFSHALVDSLAAQASGLANTQAALLAASKQVGVQ
jgi:hypothetical protein